MNAAWVDSEDVAGNEAGTTSLEPTVHHSVMASACPRVPAAAGTQETQPAGYDAGRSANIGGTGRPREGMNHTRASSLRVEGRVHPARAGMNLPRSPARAGITPVAPRARAARG